MRLPDIMRDGAAQVETADAADQFLCPGESIAVSRSVHLARLASGFPACRTCVHAGQVATLPAAVRTGIQPSDTSSIIRPEGIRGIYLNQLNRSVLSRIAATILGAAGYEGPGSAVVIGHDSRPSSPDLAIGVVEAARRSGFDVIDAGGTSRACFDFAMLELRANLGLFVTGGSGPQHQNGLDILQANLSNGFSRSMQSACRLWETQPAHRHQRQSGSYETVYPQSAYLDQVLSGFHAIRPLRVIFASGDLYTTRFLVDALKATPCETRQVTFRDDLEQTFGNDVSRFHADLGVLIQRDGRSIYFWNEAGAPFSPLELLEQAGLAVTRETTANECHIDGQLPPCDPVQLLATVLQGLSKA